MLPVGSKINSSGRENSKDKDAIIECLFFSRSKSNVGASIVNGRGWKLGKL